MDAFELAPESAALWKYFQEKQPKPYYELPNLEAVRERSRLGAQTMSGTYDFEGTRQELFIPSPDVKEGVPVYVYQAVTPKPDPAIYLYFHGGGMVVGSRHHTDIVCKKLTDAADGSLVIVNVEYRLAPEYPAPAGINDGLCATKWVLENKTKVGGSTKSKVGIGGDSSGGTITASVAHDAPGLDFQVLIYPHVVGKGRTLESFRIFEETPMYNHRKLADWLDNLYIPDGHGEDPKIASINRDRFDHLPPCLFIVAEADPIRDESYEYAKKLTAAGVHNELMLVKGALHAFYTSPGAFKELTKEPYARTLEFIKKFGTA